MHEINQNLLYLFLNSNKNAVVSVRNFKFGRYVVEVSLIHFTELQYYRSCMNDFIVISIHICFLNHSTVTKL